MEHDIRKLFEKENLENKELPKFHRQEFLKKLEESQKKKPQKKPFFFYKIASILIIFGALFYLTIDYNKPNKKEDSILVQVKNIEKVYVESINKEWNKFVAITNDTVLVDRYKEKLNQSKKDYKTLTVSLDENPDSIHILEAIISNLQRRLELLKNIQEHIKELNQKNTSHETIYL